MVQPAGRFSRAASRRRCIRARSEPVSLEMMTRIFPENLVRQEMCPDQLGRNPGSRCGRSTRCGGRRRCCGRCGWSARSRRPAHIYYKYEGTSPAGSHKVNTSVAQAFFNKDGRHEAAGHGNRARANGARPSRWPASCLDWSATCTWSRSATSRSPTGGCSCTPGARRFMPVRATRPNFGRKVLAEDPECPGSLGMAISEAVEDTVTHPQHEVFAGERA
jgi:tryptophan synthase beta chain